MPSSMPASPMLFHIGDQDFAAKVLASETLVYVFPSQRSARLTEEGIHHWFRNLKARATKDQWEQIADLTFHDLRYDFAHRAREAGWSLEEVAYYLVATAKWGLWSGLRA